MVPHGQQNLGIVPKAGLSAAPAPPGHVVDSLFPPPALEQHQNLCPLRHHLGDPLIRDGVIVHDNSPRFIGQNIVQAAQQPHGGGAGVVDPLGCFQYEDFSSIVGERMASGSLSDVSTSASDKTYSEYSSSGEHHGQRVKFMCSFGGKILPRPGDGQLRYAGGDTRIISVHRNTKYSELMHKMRKLYGQHVILKYQLPNEDLDALISISCDDDVENMMEEFDRLQASNGSNRLRLFVFSPAEYELVHMNGSVDSRNTDQIYMDAINGMEETRAVRMVPLRCANVVAGQQVLDTLSTSRILNNASYALPVVSNPQLAPALGQPVPRGMLQSSQQLLSRILTSVPPPTPTSPTISSQMSQFTQPGILDASLAFYGDQLHKSPGTHLHELQQIDAVYWDDVGAGSRTLSLNSQHKGPSCHFDVTRLANLSPKKDQYEIMLDHAQCKDQMLMADSVLPRTTSSGMPHPDSYGRLPKVGSDRILLALQQQQLEMEGPIMHPSDVFQPPVDFQNLVICNQGYRSPSGWQHARETRQDGFQRLKPVQLSVPQNMQDVAMAPHQLHVSPYSSPGVILSHEVATCNQLDQSGGTMSCLLLQKPLTMQSKIQSGQVSVPTLHSGSAPSSPRVKFQGLNSNHSGVHPVLPGHGGLNEGLLEQPSAQLIVQPQNEPVLRGLKPLNTHINLQEQPHLVDDQAARQQLPSPLSKHQVEARQHQGFHLQTLCSDGLKQSRPPFPGGSPYHECRTPLSDQRLLRGEGQVQLQYDDGFATYSNHQEGFNWAVKKPQNEKTSVGWTGLGQVDLKGEANMYFDTGKLSQSNALPTTFVNTLSSSAAYFDSHVPSGISLTPAARLPVVLDGVKVLSEATYLPCTTEVPLGNFNLMGASTAPLPVANMSTGNVSSLFEADLEEGRWVEGSQTDVETIEGSRRLSIGNTLEINAGPFLGGRLSRQASDKDLSPPDDQFSLPVADDGNLNVNRSKLIDAFHTHMMLAPSLDTSNPVDLSSRQSTPLSLGTSDPVVLDSKENAPLPPPISAGTLRLGSPSPSLAVESSKGTSCLTDDTKDYQCGDFVSYIQRDDLKFSRPINTQNVSLLASSSITNATDVKHTLPSFDSDSVEGSEHKDIKSNRGSVNVEVDVFPSTLYTEPTLSMRNWEETLATARVEDLFAEGNQNMPEDIDLHILEREALEVNVSNAVEDAEGNDVNTNPAVIAEAEAISRGLQIINNADLEELQELGTGTFGTVYHGKWRGTDVAIKRIKSSCFSGRPLERDCLIAEFWKEAYLLGQLHHPNVVAFYGVVPDGPDGTLATVTEYMVNGSLKQALQKNNRTIDHRKRLLIIMDAAFGMEYLHGKNIVHFDLKCENLLVNMKDPQRPICKVGDLGLSKVKQQTMVSGGVRGTLPWMAPELLNGSSSLVSEKVDVFSFGIVMWELLTGEEPYANMHYGAIIGGIVNNTLRPPIPSWCDPSWKALMEKCWSVDPVERPSFLEISTELRVMVNAKPQGQV